MSPYRAHALPGNHMTRTIIIVSLTTLVIAFFLFDGTAPPIQQEPPKPQLTIRRSDIKSVFEQPKTGLNISPFSSGNPTPPDSTELIKRRKQIMVAGGYTTPEKYFHMDIGELTGLERSGDVFASLQLGERYWSEAKALEYDPDADYSDAPKNIAIHHFVIAIRGGAGNVSAIVAKRMFEDGKVIEAAAWDMIAQRNEQQANQASYGKDRDFSKMSYEQLNAAQKKANEIASKLGISLLTF
jgi:hypothetical protein